MPGCEASPRINAYSGPHVCHRDLIVGQCGVGDTGPADANNVRLLNENVKSE